MEPEITETTTTEGVASEQLTDTPADTVPAVPADGETPVGEEGQEGTKPDGEQGNGEPDGKPESDDPATDTPVDYFFNGQSVEIEIPDDVDAALKEKGLDARAISAELYSKDGEFKLSEETLGKLYEAFGKFSVDAYLSGLRAANEGFIHNQARQEEARVAADTERFTTVAKECGGEEGWSRLESFALEHLSDEDLAMYNEVMSSGNQYFQTFAIRELEQRRKQIQGDDSVELLQPDGLNKDTANGPMSQAEYMAAIAELGTKFKGNRAGAAEAERALDARRRAGMARGL